VCAKVEAIRWDRYREIDMIEGREIDGEDVRTTGGQKIPSPVDHLHRFVKRLQ
jgi:hypothetical protein